MRRFISLIVIALLITGVTVTASAADGAAVFKAKCSSCHGADGKGQTTMGKKFGLRDLGSPDVQKQSDAELTKITAEGKGKMPAYGTKISADDLKAVVQFMRTFKK